jgi:hypothetical protein
MSARKFIYLIFIIFILFLMPTWGKSKLNPELAPGGNFDLRNWKLQLPIGVNNTVQEIPPGLLAGGKGFTNAYFYTDKDDGAMVMMTPKEGLTTPNTTHCRTELREMTAGWLAQGSHTLEATLAVQLVADKTVIGQIYKAGDNHHPLCLLTYFQDGTVKLHLRDNPTEGGKGTWTQVGQVKPGEKFNYTMVMDNGKLTVNVNGKNNFFDVPAAFAGCSYYFKAGNYDQDSKAGVPSTTPNSIVKFYKLEIKHGL